MKVLHRSVPRKSVLAVDPRHAPALFRATEGRKRRGMSQSIPITAVTTLMREVAAAEVLPRFRNLASDEVRTKSSSQDLVTQADLEAEAQLARRLPGLLPGSLVVGEEAAYANRTLLDRLAADTWVWVVDPVDGTANFAKGDVTFGMIVALVRGGETVAGWILDPIADRIAIAVRGAGTMVDETRVRLDPVRSGLGAMEGCAFGARGRVLKGRVRRLHYLGSAAHVYLRLLTGQLHFAAYSRLMPWDHAAGVLLHTEAGGHAGLIDGTPYTPTLLSGDLLVASHGALWREMAPLLQAARKPGA